jgi:sugar lactone lactonase YvrE
VRVAHGVIVSFVVFFVIPGASRLHAQAYTFQHHLGSKGGPGTSDGQAAAARFWFPNSVAVDASGGIFVADYNNHVIRHVTSSGRVTTVAGLANSPGSTDGRGHLARFRQPSSVTVDPSGNVFVADAGNSVIRKITPSGLVSTFAGLAGVPGSIDGTGSAARFNRPRGIACDADENVFVADEAANVIRRITPAGIATTIAGSPLESGSADGTGSLARFTAPADVATDFLGNVYVADAGNRIVRKVTPEGVVTTVAGSGVCGSTDGGPAIAEFCGLRGIGLDGDGHVYVADNGRIRMIEMPSRTVTTVAGSGSSESIDGSGIAASFAGAADVAFDADDNAYIPDSEGNTIRIANSAVWYVTTFAGLAAEKGMSESAGEDARFNSPDDAALDSTGALYVSDGANGIVRRIASGTTEPLLFAGTPGNPGTADGYPLIGKLMRPGGIAVGPADVVYVADRQASTIRRIVSNGYMTTLAGASFVTGTADDPVGTNARFSAPQDVATDAAGNVYVADTGNHTIRKITAAGAVTTFAGLAGAIGSSDGTASAARFNQPAALIVASDGNLYVTDAGNHTIRKVTMAGVVTTIAGAPGAYGSSDGAGAAARFLFPRSIAADASNNLFVVDGGFTIRKVTTGGAVSTIGGSSTLRGTEAGTSAVSRFSNPQGIASSAEGNLFVVDDQAIRRGKLALPDVATTDSTEGAVGAVRTLSSTGPTANGWSWALVRRPKGSNALPSSSHLRTTTFVPDVADLFTFRLTATESTFMSGDDESSVTEVSIRGLGPATLSLSPSTMPAGAQGLEYAATISASGGAAPYVFRHIAGSLPPGVTLGGSGVLHGVATTPGSFTFDVEATDDTSATGAQSFTVVISAAATAAEAHATSATTVAITWPPVAGATSYRVLRASTQYSFVQIATSSATTHVDTTAVANNAYLYRVVAVDGANHESQPGPFDLATTVMYTDATLIAGNTKARASHILQLRTAVNAVRAVALSGWADFSDLSLASGDPVKALHLSELRSALGSATFSLSINCSFTDSPLAAGVTRIKAVHIEELRACMR